MLTKTSTIALAAFAATLVALFFLLLAAERTTSSAPEATHTRSIASSGEASTHEHPLGQADAVPKGPLLNLHRVPTASFEQLVRERPDIVVASVVGQLEDQWPESEGAQTMVASQFRLRVDEVLSGQLEVGQEIIVKAPGGTVRVNGVSAAGDVGAKPEADDETQLVEYADWPLFRVGTTELVFLYRGADSAGRVAWGAVPEGRYHLVDGTLETIFMDPAPPNIVTARDIVSRIVGRTVEEVRHEVAATGP